MTEPTDQPKASKPARLTREEIAKIEIGHTEISRPLSWALVLVFLGTIVSVPIVQTTWEIRRGQASEDLSAVPQFLSIFGDVGDAFESAFATSEGNFLGRVFDTNADLLRDINRYEDNLEDDSLLQRWLLPPAQSLLTRYGGVGNEKAYVGRDGWLYYRPGVEYLTGPGFLDADRLRARRMSGSEWQAPPQPDPVKAIVQFRDQLAERGITLVVVPAPVKPMIHPEGLTRRYDGREIVQSPSFERLAARLESAGVLMYDPAPLLMQRKWASGDPPAPQYLRTDTHWRPDAMQAVAAGLAGFLKDQAALGQPPRTIAYRRIAQEVTAVGDIAGMIELPEGQRLFEPETVTIGQVVTPAGTAWQESPDADVLLLGDSFTNIYSLADMNWGFAAGLAEQVSAELQRPLDAIVRNDNGAFATREALSRELARGRDRLDGKKVVVWEFAARELAVGDWKLLEMTVGQPADSDLIPPEQGREITVTGTVAAIARPPRPPQPYKNMAVMMLLEDLTIDGKPAPGKQAKVMVWGMRDNAWTPAARYRIGRQVTVELQSLQDTPREVRSARRKEIPDNFDLELEEPWWGEIIED